MESPGEVVRKSNPRGIVQQREGNPFWPLPKDYRVLTKQGQRTARLNACLMQQTPELAASAWSFFCWWYLRPHKEDGRNYDPMWYVDYFPPSKFHRWLVYWYEKYPYNCVVMPRRHAKTTTTQSYCLFKAISCVQFGIGIYLSKFRPFVQQWSDKLTTQIETNERILKDFGDLRPKRGGSWSTEYRRLTNHSGFSLFSIDGNLRGFGGRFQVADDTDQEDEGQTILSPNPQKLEAARMKFLAAIGPMVGEGSGLSVIGTIREGTLVDHIMTACEDGSDNKDESFKSVENGGLWKKFKIGAHDSKGLRIWEKFSEKYYQEKKQLLGAALFESEYEGRLYRGGTMFDMSPERHEYFFKNPDGKETEDPWNSDALVAYHKCTGTTPVVTEPTTVGWKNWLAQMTRVIVIDPCTSTNATSDYGVIHVGGMDPNGTLWSLDLFAAQKLKSVDAIDIALAMAAKWKVSWIGIESVLFQEEWTIAAKAQVEAMAEYLEYVPQVVGIKPPMNMDKASRIRTLAWRFDWGRIKYPADRIRERPYQLLYQQTRAFGSPMKYDDVLDTVEMLQSIFKTHVPPTSIKEESLTAAELMMQGETIEPDTGLPLGIFVPLQGLNPATKSAIMAIARARRVEKAQAAEAEDRFFPSDIASEWYSD